MINEKDSCKEIVDLFNFSLLDIDLFFFFGNDLPNRLWLM